MSNKTLTETQINMVKKFIDHFQGQTVVARRDLLLANMKLFGEFSVPSFISANPATKLEGVRGMINLGILIPMAAAKKAPQFGAQLSEKEIRQRQREEIIRKADEQNKLALYNANRRGPGRPRKTLPV